MAGSASRNVGIARDSTVYTPSADSSRTSVADDGLPNESVRGAEATAFDPVLSHHHFGTTSHDNFDSDAFDPFGDHNGRVHGLPNESVRGAEAAAFDPVLSHHHFGTTSHDDFDSDAFDPFGEHNGRVQKKLLLRTLSDEGTKAFSESMCPDEWRCPITYDVMHDPCTICDGTGQSYERHALETWLARHDTSPLTNLRLPSKAITSNVLLRNEIKAAGATCPPVRGHPGCGGGGGAGGGGGDSRVVAEVMPEQRSCQFCQQWYSTREAWAHANCEAIHRSRNERNERNRTSGPARWSWRNEMSEMMRRDGSERGEYGEPITGAQQTARAAARSGLVAVSGACLAVTAVAAGAGGAVAGVVGGAHEVAVAASNAARRRTGSTARRVPTGTSLRGAWEGEQMVPSVSRGVGRMAACAVVGPLVGGVGIAAGAAALAVGAGAGAVYTTGVGLRAAGRSASRAWGAQ